MREKLTPEERLKRRRDSRARWREKKKPGSVGRPKGRTPLPPEERAKRRRLAMRRAAKKWWRRNSIAIAEKRGKWSRRHSELGDRLAAEGLTIVSRATAGGTHLTYIDTAGRVHREDTRSAEQLIRDFLRAEARTKHAPKKEGAPP